MESNKRTLQIIIELLKQNNINQIVISPGGTNAEFIRLVQDDDFFECYSVVDERSAMYFAIGLYLQTGKVIAASCTSAQATRNYVPGLTEAFYKRVPILALTMEKHQRFIGQEYMQAPHQDSLPDDCVKKTFSMPYISDVNDEYYAIRVVNEAILELCHEGNGPVQLCIPWLDFEISGQSPDIRKISRHTTGKDVQEQLPGKKIMIVVGEHRPFQEQEIQAIERFCDSYNCVVYTNHLSNYNGKYKFNGNFVFSTISLEIFANQYAPDILISIGGQTGDYPFYLIFSKPQVEKTVHWRVSEDGKIIDTYDKLTDVFAVSEIAFFSSFLEAKSNHSYYEQFIDLDKKINRNIELPFSNAYIAQKMHSIIPDKSVVQFAILNSLRIWNLFPLHSSIECYSNVGAFGIDGGLSTLIGQSMISEELCFMITGDLAFFYDMNSLGIRGIKNNLRILLINNNGGIEFKLWKGKDPQTDRYVAAANHFKNAKGWAETCGFKYISAMSEIECEVYLPEFVEKSEKPILFEVFVSDEDESKAYKELIQNNRSLTINDILKKGIKKLVSR